eukprot:scaffold329771_cov61-Tisochrysis_lutea.AAC.4
MVDAATAIQDSADARKHTPEMSARGKRRSVRGATCTVNWNAASCPGTSVSEWTSIMLRQPRVTAIETCASRMDL